MIPIITFSNDTDKIPHLKNLREGDKSEKEELETQVSDSFLKPPRSPRKIKYLSSSHNSLFSTTEYEETNKNSLTKASNESELERDLKSLRKVTRTKSKIKKVTSDQMSLSTSAPSPSLKKQTTQPFNFTNLLSPSVIKKEKEKEVLTPRQTESIACSKDKKKAKKIKDTKSMENLALKIPPFFRYSQTVAEKKNQDRHSSNSTLFSNEQEISIQTLKEILSHNQPISFKQIYHITSLLIPSGAYNYLHLMCEEKYAEENIEFLFDYLHWIHTQENQAILNHEVLEDLIEKYINNDTEKTINIEGNSRLLVIQAFKNKNFNEVARLLKEISEMISLLLWLNIFSEAFAEDETQELILKFIL